MPKLNPDTLVIKVLGFLHIALGLYAALKTTLYIRNEPFSGFTVFFLIFIFSLFGLPLILGGVGLVTFKNRARVFLVFYDFLILLVVAAPLIQIALQGPKFHKYWVEVFLKTSIPLLIVIYLLLPSVKRYFR